MELPELGTRLDEIKELGARGAELLLTQRTGFILEANDSNPSNQQPVSHTRLSVRVWLEGGRHGEASGASTNIHTLATKALANAEGAPENPLLGPIDRLSSVSGGLSIRDRRFEHVSEFDRTEVLTTALRAAASQDPRLQTSDFRYEDELEVRRFVNSKGLALEESATTYRASCCVSAASPSGPLRISDSIASRSFASIASIPFGTTVGRRLVAMLDDAETLPEGPVRVLMPARVTARLVSALGKGFLRANLEDSSAFFLQRTPDHTLDRRLHLVDDGSLSGGLRTYSMDDRGVSPTPLTLLREGVVDSGYIGIAEARQRDLRPTGHQWGDTLRASNLVLKSGTRSVNACLSDMGGPSFKIDDLPPDAIDIVKGEIDTVVHGLVMEANKVVGAMRGVRIRGSLYDVLNSVAEVCSDTDRLGHVDAPAMIVHGFTLGG